jgi:putative AlgH/UPF0301 family transcriptional regulator
MITMGMLFTFGISACLKWFAVFFPAVVLALYIHGFKLSVLNGGGRQHLGLTSFGPPVEGLGKGMLLVSMGAGGPFAKTVLYVHEHSDNGSLAFILNGRTEEIHEIPTAEGVLKCSIRTGGPVKVRGYWCIHNVSGVLASERLVPEKNFFISSGIGSLQGLVKSCQMCGKDNEFPRALFIKDVSSWGPHQLDGEMRRYAWGWIRPEHVNLDDVFDFPRLVNGLVPGKEDPSIGQGFQSGHSAEVQLWEQLVNSPHLEVFQG